MTTKIMKTLGAATLGIAVFLTLFTVPCAFAAVPITANVPFPFQVESKTMPAGEYRFTTDLQTRLVNIQGPKDSDAVVPFLTTLAAQSHTNAADMHIIFDKVDNTYYLSELWEPGKDGVMVYAAKGPHEHHVLHVK
jgi:hypothetical protein